ncbi:histidine kinase-like protein [Streptomyces sp. CG 926]|nr:histidine kinase-like protein [Streptomyces sp. CG 926]
MSLLIPISSPFRPRRTGLGSLLAREVIGVIDTDGECAEWAFPAEPGAVRTARHAVRGTLHDWGLEAVGDVTVLLVSELVTNSLRYASGPIGVRLERRNPAADGPAAGPALLVEVSDPLPDPPRERAANHDDEGGRGLHLVAASSQRWGTRHGKSGKTVWFELALPGE